MIPAHDKICQDSRGKRNDETCQVPITTNTVRENSHAVANSSQIKTMKPNNIELFYYPDTSKEPDTYKLFMSIRFPECM